MKAKFFDRLLVMASAVLLLFIGCAFIVMAFIPAVSSLLVNSTTHYSNSLMYRILAIIPALAFIFVAIRLLFITLMREPKVKNIGVTVQSTSDGEIQISVAALDTLVKKCIASITGIVEVNSKIIGHDDSITIDVKLSVYDGYNIPEITMKLQQKIKSTIQEESGIAVREVKILVDKVVARNEDAPSSYSISNNKKITSIIPKLNLNEIPEPKPEIDPYIEPMIEPSIDPDVDPISDPELPTITDEIAQMSMDNQEDMEQDAQLLFDDVGGESQKHLEA